VHARPARTVTSVLSLFLASQEKSGSRLRLDEAETMSHIGDVQVLRNTVSRWLLTIVCTVSHGRQRSFQWEEIQKSMYDLASDGYELKSAENNYVWEGGSLKSSFVTSYGQKIRTAGKAGIYPMPA
jgi:hypothetical protein